MMLALSQAQAAEPEAEKMFIGSDQDGQEEERVHQRDR